MGKNQPVPVIPTIAYQVVTLTHTAPDGYANGCAGIRPTVGWECVYRQRLLI